MLDHVTTFAGFVCRDQAAMTKRNVMVIVYGVLIVLLVHMLLRLVAKDNQRLVTVLTIFSIVIAVGVSIAAILLGTDWGCKIF